MKLYAWTIAYTNEHGESYAENIPYSTEIIYTDQICGRTRKDMRALMNYLDEKGCFHLTPAVFEVDDKHVCGGFNLDKEMLPWGFIEAHEYYPNKKVAL
jgi:hypothetical protein